MKNIINKELLFTHFEGRTTPIQTELLRKWLKSGENQQRYYHWLQEWERKSPQIVTSAEDAYARFEQQVMASVQLPETSMPSTWERWRFRPYYIAASLTALLVIVGYLTQSYWTMRTISTEYGEVRSVVLPDGSRVTLNANSELQIPRFSFGSSSREVYLKGEAEFAVAHTPKHDRFRVLTANNVEVVVLGTEFVVNTRRNNTKVVLNRGKVQLRFAEQNKMNTLTMQPGDWVSLSEGSRPERGRQPVEQTTAAAWKNYEYNFQKTPMSEIADLLTDNFGMEVQIDSVLAKRTVTGTFHAHNSDELLQAMIELFDVQADGQGNKIRLRSIPSEQADIQ
jgi:transmembrane sensor